MFEDDNQDGPGGAEEAGDPADMAKEKVDEFRVHAQLAAVYEAPRKFAAKLLPTLDGGLAKDIQRAIGKLEKARSPETPVLPEASMSDAADLLTLHDKHGLSTMDYHIHRRPGEVVMVRWLAAEQVETFYERLQAHFDVAFGDFKEEEKSAKGWKQDPKTQAFLAALDGMEVKMPERYLREVIRQHRVFVLSTQTADEIDILYLCEHLMGISPAAVVGKAAAPQPPEPGEEPAERDRAWFFKLFALRGIKDNIERMCFFTYLQKSDDSFDFE